jgi:serine-type D-Ala-D-Ala carboxypeptidase (penicillin-binding protein 5/6)
MMPRTLTLSALSAAALATLLLAQPAQTAVPIPAAPQLDARGYLLVDYESGRVLAEQRADERMEPASLTKLMTAYVAFHALADGKIRLDEPVTISTHAWKAEGSRTFVQVGTQVPVDVLMQGMIVQSGNDATIAVAERIGGDEKTFAELMNNYAKQLGMRSTNFTNSTGLPDPQHYTTARDIAILSRAIIREFPQYYRWYSQRDFTWNKIRQENRNGLLIRDARVDGIKTGHTESAGYCLVTSAQQDDMRLVTVVLGTKSFRAREDSSLALLNYGFNFFETRKVYSKGRKLGSMRVWKAEESPVDVGLSEDLILTVPRGQAANLTGTVRIKQSLIAPVASTTDIGELQIHLGGEVIARRPLHPLKEVEQGGLWRRSIDAMWLWFE